MGEHHFISYSRQDGEDFAFQLYDALRTRSRYVPWLDQRDLRAVVGNWDDHITEAIKTCRSFLFVISPDSLHAECQCGNECTKALQYYKPVIPIRIHPDVNAPLQVVRLQCCDFTGDFEDGFKDLCDKLDWLDSPDGVLRELKRRRHALGRKVKRSEDDGTRARTQQEIDELSRQIERQQQIVENPDAATKKAQERIDRGFEREKRSGTQKRRPSAQKCVNAPPCRAPDYFQDRDSETRRVEDFLRNEALRLMMVVGWAGIGKTAMVCRVLQAVQDGRIAGEAGPLHLHGVVYLCCDFPRRLTIRDLFANLAKLLPRKAAREIDELCTDCKVSTEEKMHALLTRFSGRPVVLFLDRFDLLVDFDDQPDQTPRVADPDVAKALSTLLVMSHHPVKVILTTRVAPKDFQSIEPGRHTLINLAGLDSPYAERMLREQDPDSSLRLKTVPEDLLHEARERTRGFPKALEALCCYIRSNMRYLPEILEETQDLLPDAVLKVLVGDAFNGLDTAAQRVVQALAVYGRPVPPVAVDHLLLPYLPGIDSEPILRRLLGMQFVVKQSGRYRLDEAERTYALKSIPRKEDVDR